MRYAEVTGRCKRVKNKVGEITEWVGVNMTHSPGAILVRVLTKKKYTLDRDVQLHNPKSSTKIA